MEILGGLTQSGNIFTLTEGRHFAVQCCERDSSLFIILHLLPWPFHTAPPEKVTFP